ncbi:MAG: glycosyltransferase, partial [Deltaproteobacteria bacterium]|nr:glycosyltransferase [Deltaproteobacteria bacterium]
EGYSVWKTDMVRKTGPFSLPFHNITRRLPGPGEPGPLVSVIVLARDRPARLTDALRSVAGQTYANVEIVVVNDGGAEISDGVQALAGEIPVTCIAPVRRGRAAAANAGLRAARGAYLNFLDEDAVFLPDHVETLVSGLISTHSKVAYSNTAKVYTSGWEDRIKTEAPLKRTFDRRRLFFENYISTISVLFSREVPAETGGFDEQMKRFGDWDFWIRVSRRLSFLHVNKLTAKYRVYDPGGVRPAGRMKPFVAGKSWVGFVMERCLAGFRRTPCATRVRAAWTGLRKAAAVFTARLAQRLGRRHG